MSKHVAGIEALEARRMMFAQPLVDDADTVKRFVAMTDAAIYFERQPTSLGNNEASDTRAYVRLSRSRNKLETLKPASGTWDLSDLSNVRTLGGDTVVLEFDDGTMWSVRDGSTKAEKLIGLDYVDFDGMVAVGHTLYFSGTGAGGRELYATDGTADGTRALPQLRAGGDGGSPRNLVAAGDDLLFVGSTDKVKASRLIRWDGKAFRPVEAMKGRSVSEVAVSKGRVVVVSDGKLLALSSDYKTATPFAASRAIEVTHLATVGGGVAFLSGGGVYRSDLTTKGTVRLGDAPVEHTDGDLTDVHFDSAGYLVHAYNGAHLSGGTIQFGDSLPTTPSPTPPAVYRLEAKGLTKLLDGSYATTAHVGGATYFVAGVGGSSGGDVVRVDAAGGVTSLDVSALGARAASDDRSLVFAGGDGGTALYLVDAKSKLGAVRGSVFSDDNLNRKFNGSDDLIVGGTVFADYDGDRRRDDDEPTATIGDADGTRPGEFTLLGLRTGAVDAVASVGGNYRGGVAVARVTVAAASVVTTRLLATPLLSTIRVEVYGDRDLDGVRDKKERGVGGYTVFLDADADGAPDAGEPTRTTDADGVATFDRLPAATYRVHFKRANDAESFTTPQTVTVQTAGEGSRLVRAGVHADPATASIAGRLNSETRSPHFERMFVQLWDGDDLVAETQPSTSGRFRFEGLLGGEYRLRVRAEGRIAATVVPPVVKAYVNLQTSAKLQVRINPIVRGIVWKDTNRNGYFDPDDERVAGVSVSALERWTTNSVTTTTDTRGVYEMILPLPAETLWDGAVDLTSRVSRYDASQEVTVGETYNTFNGEFSKYIQMPIG